MEDSVSELDPIIHQPLRLKIMASLSALRHDEKIDFTWLKRALDATDGNLGMHLQKLEEAGYIDVEKKFEKRKPKTLISINDKGRSVLKSHVAALKEIVGGIG